MDKTQRRSRILLTVLLLVPLSVSLFFLFGGYPLYGAILLFGGLAGLIWVWYPHDKQKKDTKGT